MHRINKATIRLLASLSALTFTEKELERFMPQFEEVVTYISKIKALHTKKVTPMFHAVTLTNVFQDTSYKNEHKKTKFSVTQALSNATATSEGMFVVPKILEK